MKKVIIINESQLKKILDNELNEQGNWPMSNYTGGQIKSSPVNPSVSAPASTVTSTLPTETNGKPLPDITTKDGKHVIKLSDAENVKSIQRALFSIANTKTQTSAGGIKQYPEIESFLKTYVTKSGIDGVYGRGTRNAVSFIQKVAGLPQTGYVNNATAKFLMNNAGYNLKTGPIKIKSMFVPNPNPPQSKTQYTTVRGSSLHPDITPIEESIRKALKSYKK